MQHIRRLGGMALLLTVGLGLAACDDDDPISPVGPDPDVEEGVLTGTLTADRTLSADTTYLLKGVVLVEDGATLTIEPGTLILGDVATQPTALVIQQGGRIDAQGTADAPIVFTSSNPAGSRARGDWGGVVLNGRSICNFPDAADCVAEGFPGSYGGDVLDDDSGIMRYVRVEFAGYEVSLGNELNAYTFNGVGSGTTLEYLQAHQGLDDGFEWFGGTVDLKYAVASGISDDSFDYSTGWQGRGQFWIALQDPDDADNGFEVDNNAAEDALPRTNPSIYNVTLVGKGDTGTAGESTRGLLFRLGTAGDVGNVIVTGFEDGLDIDNASTHQQCVEGNLVLSNSIIYGNGSDLADDDDTFEVDCMAQPGWDTILHDDPMLADPFNWDAPDFAPQAGSPAAVAANAATVPGEWFTAVDYIGAVDPSAATRWYEGWTTWEKAVGQQ
ncbi:MAG TPA: hypothetical protein VK966_09330 [Longimicrobiales bacterium]|nr:hypothetical protein [Longimicrobiales bacterium]